MNDLGELILDHYEKYLGEYAGADIYSNGSDQIQLLGYDNTIRDCLLFATFGLSKCADKVGGCCEAILVTDSDYDSCAEVFINSVFYAVTNGLSLSHGSLITGADAVSTGFSSKHGKSAVYFTDIFLLPDDFAEIDDKCRMLMALLVSENEAEFIKTHGFTAFEDLLEENDVDVFDINRPSVV
ncbi:MAG: suppressor of fused domain protein [Ruminococcus sp.]|nr:suppressor of fused domain protein [Ruminococcus sp.]